MAPQGLLSKNKKSAEFSFKKVVNWARRKYIHSGTTDYKPSPQQAITGNTWTSSHAYSAWTKYWAFFWENIWLLWQFPRGSSSSIDWIFVQSMAAINWKQKSQLLPFSVQSISYLSFLKESREWVYHCVNYLKKTGLYSKTLISEMHVSHTEAWSIQWTVGRVKISEGVQCIRRKVVVKADPDTVARELAIRGTMPTTWGHDLGKPSHCRCHTNKYQIQRNIPDICLIFYTSIF